MPLLNEDELHTIVVGWNDTQAAYPDQATIHQQFEIQAERCPDAVALVCGDQEIRYGALNRRANQVAHHLRHLGVRRDELVGICIERSIDLVVGLLGILKAGGAYLPLDAGYPRERSMYMLENAQARVLITRQHLAETLSASNVEAVLLDADWPEIARRSQENPDPVATADDLAYVNYTSGSTGKPKAVAIPHRGVIRLLFGSNYAELSPTRVFLQLAPIGFDAATFELWGALLHGARCVLFAGALPTIGMLRDALGTHGVTTLFLTTALFNTIVDEAPEILAGVQQVLTGGEAHSVAHMRRALQRLSSTEIISCYGPTESTTFTTFYPVPRDLDEHATSIPIGRPLSNTQVYVLDDSLYPVPVGVVGELYIGGAGLARGYLNQADLTRERFVTKIPFLGPEARLYKTGDLARYLPDGNLDFVGRVDNQVKIHGFRIELEEIEAVLLTHPKLRHVAVIVESRAYDDKRLTAFLAASMDGASTDEAALIREVRGVLAEKLPHYMIPSRFLVLAKLPLTPHGKVDRKQLSSLLASIDA